MQDDNAHAKGAKDKECKAVLLCWTWHVAALPEPFLGLWPCSEPKCWRQVGIPPNTAPWAGLSSPDTPVLPRWGSGQYLGVQPPILRANGFLMSASLTPLSVVMRVAASPCASHYGCETKPNPTVWTAPRHDHTQATPSPSASARTDSASNLCAMGMPKASATAGAWVQAGRRALRAGERVQAATSRTSPMGWWWTAGSGGRVCQPGLAVIPAACSTGWTFCGWRVQAGLQPLLQSEHHIHIPLTFFWHLFSSLEVAELQEGRVKREMDLTCHVPAALAVSEFASCPELCLSRAELS